MKVLLLNGSPHERGCTYTALREAADALEREGVETEIFHIGAGAVRGCAGCGACRRKGEHRCIFSDDRVNEALAKAEQADGYFFGAPVHYASIAGAASAFLDRMFYAGGSVMAYKPAAVVVSARRAGTTAAYDQLNKYIGINNMLAVPCHYWNMVHGSKPEDVLQDEEGMQCMRALGRNMAWMLSMLKVSREHGVLPPAPEPRIHTNFIR